MLVSTEADEQMLGDLMRLVRQLVCDGDLMLARMMRQKVIEKCDYFTRKHQTSQNPTLLPSYQLTVKYVCQLSYYYNNNNTTYYYYYYYYYYYCCHSDT